MKAQKLVAMTFGMVMIAAPSGGGAFAQRAAHKGTVQDSGDSGLERPESAAVAYPEGHFYWSQFGPHHVVALPVLEWLALLGDSGETIQTLWTGTLKNTAFAIRWDPVKSSVMIERDGVNLEDVLTFFDETGKPWWNADFDEKGYPGLLGYIDVDEVNARIILHLEGSVGSYKMLALAGAGIGAVASGDSEPVASATCACFGLGPATKGCSQTECDQGIKCGKNRACRNVAGTSE